MTGSTEDKNHNPIVHCVYRDRLLTFSHTLYCKNIWEPRGDHVIMESALYRTAL